MKRILLLLLVSVLVLTGTINYALRGPNDYGDTKNRDAMFEYRKIDHERDDPFYYEWVSQSGSDSDGPVSTYSTVHAEQAYGLPFYTSAYTSFGCNNKSQGRYHAKASVIKFESHLGLTRLRMIDSPDTPFAFGSYYKSFSKVVFMGFEWNADWITPRCISDYELRFGDSIGVITVKERRGEEEITLHKAESEAPVEHPDVSEW